MIARRRVLSIVLALLALLWLVPAPVLADEGDPLLIDSEVVASATITASPSAHSLLVQATSWVGSSHVYFLTLVNLSPWKLSHLYVVERYFPDDPAVEELVNDWLVEPLEPGRAASLVITYPDDPFPNACHQIEINLTDGLGTVLMDCNPPGSTLIWNIALSEELAAYLAAPELTLEAPSGRSKIGIHVTRNSSPAIMEFVRNAQPAVVAAVGDLGWLSEVKEVSPDTVTVGRLLEGDQSFEGDPVERAREFVNANAEVYLANPGVDYWLGWNEPVIQEPWQMEWYAAFEGARTVAMAELGLKVAIGNFSAGTPEAAEFEAFMPAIAVAKEYGGILAVHEYSAPTMRDGVGAGIPGLEGRHDFGALTLRYRFWYEYYLRPNDLVIPLVVTEAGIDGGVLRSPDVKVMGWRDLSETLSQEAPTNYMEQLSWYDDELRRDSYVLGFAIFNVGDHGGRWSSFDMTGILPQLADLVNAKS